MIDQEHLRASILRKLHQWVEVMPDPDKPFVGFAGGRGSLSPQQIVEEVENGTRLGQRFVQNWVQLAVNHIIESSLLRPAEVLSGDIATRETASPQPLRLGDVAPDFTAETTEGRIRFHEWMDNSWVCLFSHPKDFAPVGTTELGYIARIKPEFERRNVKVIGLSIDQSESHKRWAEDIRETQGTPLNFPVIADPNHKVAKLYDMVLHPHISGALAASSVFIIGPDKKIKLMITYPARTGRNFDEILRVIDSLQLTAKYSVATPVNWKDGDDVVIVPSMSDKDAKAKFPAGWKAPKPYLRITPQPNRISKDAKAKDSSSW